MKEYLDLYDKNRKPLNKTILRGEKIEDNEYFIVVLGILINNKNEILLTKRSETKSIAPGLWECTAGSIISGESSLNAIIREIKEETGLTIKETDIVFQHSFNERNAIFDVWLTSENISFINLKLDPLEVDEAKILHVKELKNFINQNNVTKSLYEVLKVVESKYINLVKLDSLI